MPISSGVARFKLVIAATKGSVQRYPSIESLPEQEQREARDALEGELAATLLIADRKGLDRMKELLGRTGEKPVSRRVPLGVAKQLGAGFIVAGCLLAALLMWTWLR